MWNLSRFRTKLRKISDCGLFNLGRCIHLQGIVILLKSQTPVPTPIEFHMNLKHKNKTEKEQTDLSNQWIVMDSRKNEMLVWETFK